MRTVRELLLGLVDVLGSPATAIAGGWLRLLRRIGVQRLPVSRRVLYGVGVFPVRDHYYEPAFHPRHLGLPLDKPRHLPGIDLNTAGQLRLLEQFRWGEELMAFPRHTSDPLTFAWENRSFEAGDGEILYSMIRHFRPQRMIEIGSGNSTLIATSAFRRNQAEAPESSFELICIEPYERDWLERTGARVMRRRVEDVDLEIFRALQRHDILFIDSSHMVRPQGDVLREILEILPSLQPGVIVHIHDIYTPRDYPARRLLEEVRFWNEQYVLEAFLSGNRTYTILAAVNYLRHDYGEELFAACPVLASMPGQEPGSLWMVRND